MSTKPRRGSESVKKLKTAADTAQARLHDARRTVPAVDAAFELRGRDVTVGGNLMACAIAYRLFVWMLPFSLLLASVLGFLGASQADNPAEVAHDIGMSAYVASLVREAAEQAQDSRWVLLAIGLWGLYSASAAGAKTFTAVSDLIWRMPVHRPEKTLKAAVGFTGLLLLAIGMTLVAAFLRKESPGLGLIAAAVIFVAYAALALLILVVLPHGDAPWTRLIRGALFAAVGAQVLHLATVFYFANKIASASQLYGGLGAAAAVLLWLYLLGRVIVGASVINATLWERDHGAGATEQPAIDLRTVDEPSAPAPNGARR